MQIFHRSANVISRASIYAGIFTLAGVLWACIQFQRSPYVTYAGVARRTAYRGAYYAGAAAVGAAAVGAAAYYRPYGYAPPACGYYPYPPCY